MCPCTRRTPHRRVAAGRRARAPRSRGWRTSAAIRAPGAARCPGPGLERPRSGACCPAVLRGSGTSCDPALALEGGEGRWKFARCPSRGTSATLSIGVMLRFCAGVGAALLAVAVVACGKPGPGSASPAASESESAPGQSPPAEGDGKPVTPPFAVHGELEGLLLIWFDDQGTHTAARRADVPEARRARVRIDALDVAPDKRLDA